MFQVTSPLLKISEIKETLSFIKKKDIFIISCHKNDRTS